MELEAEFLGRSALVMAYYTIPPRVLLHELSVRQIRALEDAIPRVRQYTQLPTLALGFEQRLRGTGFGKVKATSFDKWLQDWTILPPESGEPKPVYSEGVVNSFEIAFQLKLASQATLSALNYKRLKRSGWRADRG